MSSPERIAVLEGGSTLPVENILTGRGFITGKSGSGKSNTASVVVEELLAAGFPLLVVDTEGEYYGLKERYELLHAGADERCDVIVDADDADALATVALEREYPIVLDVSGYFDVEVAEALIEATLEAFFRREQALRKPFLVIVEEIQEYLPQRGGSTDLSKLLLRIAKRGRKRGLGVCGLSQRPSAVDKDFITQCDWMVWHRLTWETDVDVVRRILGDEVADGVADLDAGEAFLLTDWDEGVDRVRFRRKETFDAGGTPALDEDREEPEFVPIDPEIVRRFAPVDAGTTGVTGDTGDAPDDGGADRGDYSGDDGGPAADSPAEADSDSDSGGVDPDDGSGASAETASERQDDLASLRAELDRLRERNATLESALRDAGIERPATDRHPGTGAGDGRSAAARGPRRRALDARPGAPPDGPAAVVVEIGQMIAYAVRGGVRGLRGLVGSTSAADADPPPTMGQDDRRLLPVPVDVPGGRATGSPLRRLATAGLLVLTGAVLAVAILAGLGLLSVPP